MEPMTLEELGEPRYFDSESFTVAGLTASYTQATVAEIPKLWDSFIAMLDKLDPMAHATYGVVYRTQPMRYVCGVAVESIATVPEDWMTETVPAQRYAGFTGEGGIPSIRRMWPGLFKHWVPLHAHELSEGPVIEFYPEKFGAGHERFEIWLPLHP